MLDVELNAKRSKFIAHRKLISISLMSIGISICLVFMRLDVWGNNVFVCDSIGLCVVEIAPGHRWYRSHLKILLVWLDWISYARAEISNELNENSTKVIILTSRTTLFPMKYFYIQLDEFQIRPWRSSSYENEHYTDFCQILYSAKTPMSQQIPGQSIHCSDWKLRRWWNYAENEQNMKPHECAPNRHFD